MEVLLLQDIPGVGKKNDLLLVGDGYALNFLLPNQKALVATPTVRRRYAEHIKRRAMERQQEKEAMAGAAAAVTGKSVSFDRKATKTGKLYAAISEKNIVEALKEQLKIEEAVPENIVIKEQIKALGDHEVVVKVGEAEGKLLVKVTEQK